MAITNFIPELWASAVQAPFEKALVFGQPSVSNTKYEGTIRNQGDTVNITTISDPTIKSYDKNEDIDVEDLADGQLQLVIDQGDYFAFRVNDIDKVQAAGDFQGPATQRAGFGLKDKVDQFIASQFALSADNGGPHKDNRLGDVEVINGTGTGRPGDSQTTAYNVLVDLGNKLNKQSAPSDGRNLVIDRAFLSSLLYNPRISRVHDFVTAVSLRNVIMGCAAGFDILLSNNVIVSSGKRLVVAGITDPLSTAIQLPEVEALSPEKRYAAIISGWEIN